MSQADALIPIETFAPRVLAWFDVHGRHDLPWQHADNPFAVWVSEIMLQQTQVKTVLRFYDRFMKRFPTVEMLAAADWDEVATYWQGLGYYARARNLHRAAQQIAPQVALSGWPKTLDAWIALPGVGRSTAGALMSLGMRDFGVIMDGNVKRVLTRYFAIGEDSTAKATLDRLWHLATCLTPQARTADYNQAMMDLGATLCTRRKPLCLYCPLNEDCAAFQEGQPEAYPVKPAARTTPTYSKAVWCLVHDEQTLWLRRPDTGIWGGLWSLPITDPDTTEVHADWLNQAAVATVTHGFTHQTWVLSLYLIKIAHLEGIPASWLDTAQWLTADEVLTRALPKPIRQLWNDVYPS